MRSETRIPWWRLTDEERLERRYQESLELRELEDTEELRDAWFLKFNRVAPKRQTHLTTDLSTIRGDHRGWEPVESIEETAA